jgi:queuine tRNA-ribosyltransferase
MTGFAFELLDRCVSSKARSGRMHTPHGPFHTPTFMPVGTRGSVKGVAPSQLREAGCEIVLANTYHLELRPGSELVGKLGGLHAFMGWDGPILTDSGGFQIFSLNHLTRVDEDGADIRSVVDGSIVRFTPEGVIDIQRQLGADIVMAFDHCPTDPLERAEVEDATLRTHRWLERCVAHWRRDGGVGAGQALFGIVQGGAFEDLRRESVQAVCEHDLPGYAIGGVRLGEGRDEVLLAIDSAVESLPEDRPRYLMGVGTPLDLYEAVERGIDMFDCVTPTRHGRNHQAFTSQGRINLRNERWREDAGPLDPDCDCSTCRAFSRAYLRHLASSGEMLAGVLLSVHNLRFFQRLMEDFRRAIANGSFHELRARVERADPRG